MKDTKTQSIQLPVIVINVIGAGFLVISCFLSNASGSALITGDDYSARHCNGLLMCVGLSVLYLLLIIFNAIVASIAISPIIALIYWQLYKDSNRKNSILTVCLLYVLLAGVYLLPLLGAAAYAVVGGDDKCSIKSYPQLMSYACWWEGTLLTGIIIFIYFLAVGPVALLIVLVKSYKASVPPPDGPVSLADQ